jgi:predicted transposase YdaD
MKYDEGIRKYRDTICVMDYAIEKGMEKGMEKGIEKGLAQGRAEGLKEGLKKGMEKGEKKGRYDIARNLLSMGLSVESIMQATGLSRDEITSLM